MEGREREGGGGGLTARHHHHHRHSRTLARKEAGRLEGRMYGDSKEEFVSRRGCK